MPLVIMLTGQFAMISTFIHYAGRFLLLLTFMAIVTTILVGGFAVAILTTFQLFKGLSVQSDTETSITVIAMILFPMLALAPLINWWFKLWSNIDQAFSGRSHDVADNKQPPVLLRCGICHSDISRNRSWPIIGLVAATILIVARLKYAPNSRRRRKKN